MATYSEPRRSEGGDWLTTETGDDGIRVNIWLAGPADPTAAERITYEPACGWCWIGAAHSGDAHRRYIYAAGDQRYQSLSASAIRRAAWDSHYRATGKAINPTMTLTRTRVRHVETGQLFAVESLGELPVALCGPISDAADLDELSYDPTAMYDGWYESQKWAKA